MSFIKTSKKNANKDKKKFNFFNTDLVSGHVHDEKEIPKIHVQKSDHMDSNLIYSKNVFNLPSII